MVSSLMDATTKTRLPGWWGIASCLPEPIFAGVQSTGWRDRLCRITAFGGNPFEYTGVDRFSGFTGVECSL